MPRAKQRPTIGERFDRLMVTGHTPKGDLYTKCDCGTEKVIRNRHWGKTRSCGCLARQLRRERLKGNPSKKPEVVEVGGRYQMLTVIAKAPTRRFRRYVCRCDCGNETVLDSVKIGSQKSCGCLRNKHGVAGVEYRPTLRSWGSMLSRCNDIQNNRWPLYGGQGVMVCERWHSFQNFLADMGKRPSGTTLGRHGDEGNYEPGNVAWMTREEQERNRKKREKPRVCCVFCRRNVPTSSISNHICIPTALKAEWSPALRELHPRTRPSGKAEVVEIGRRYEMLTVMARAPTQQFRMYLCLCDCGNQKVLSSVKIGKQKSCGCARRRRITT